MSLSGSIRRLRICDNRGACRKQVCAPSSPMREFGGSWTAHMTHTKTSITSYGSTTNRRVPPRSLPSGNLGCLSQHPSREVDRGAPDAAGKAFGRGFSVSAGSRSETGHERVDRWDKQCWRGTSARRVLRSTSQGSW